MKIARAAGTTSAGVGLRTFAARFLALTYASKLPSDVKRLLTFLVVIRVGSSDVIKNLRFSSSAVISEDPLWSKCPERWITYALDMVQLELVEIAVTVEPMI